MNYRLVVLTHGEAPRLAGAVGSWADYVTPQPSSVLLRCDRPTYDPWKLSVAIGARLGCPVAADWATAEGFCRSTARAWAIAASGSAIPEGTTEDASAYTHVAWLEHDFLVDRPVDLAQVAAVLDRAPMLAQMAFMRDAYSAEEHTAGGLFELRRADYELREFNPETGISLRPNPDWHRPGRLPWLEHRAYFTTNPSLMRREFMADHPWPDDGEPFCEGRFGISLVEQGFRFGVWGSGEVWVRHLGQRDGTGHGY